MKKINNIFKLTLISILLLLLPVYSIAKDNTFTMPSDSSQKASNYHIYNINNNTNSPINKSDIKINNNTNYQKKNSKKVSTINNQTNKSTKSNKYNTNIKTKSNKSNTHLNKINKIEIMNHFIKLKVGETVELKVIITPNKASKQQLAYNIYNSSIAEINNKTITGISKGFTTIYITLPNETVKAACSIKVI